MKKLITKRTLLFLMVFILLMSMLMIFVSPSIALAEELAVTPTPKPTSDGEVSFWKDPIGSISQGAISAISQFFLWITIQMAGLIDLVIGLFKKLVGLETVKIGDEGNQNLVNYFLELDSIKNIFLIFLGVGVLLLLVFTIIQTIKGMQNSEDEKLHPKRTFENFLKSILNILMVPVVMIIFIFTTNVVMGEVNKGMTNGMFGGSEVEISYGGQILLLMAKDDKYKLQLLDTTDWENYRKEDFSKFFDSNGQPLATINEMGNNSIIKKENAQYPNFKYMEVSSWMEKPSLDNNGGGIYYNNINNLNVFVGFAGAVSLLFVLITCAFTFIKRLFDIILLYIVSPLIISTLPIDDGKRFSAWRDMLISKVLSAYAIIITLNLYFMIIPVVTINPGVTFFGGVQNSIANGTVQLLFVIGGAFALNGANLLFSQLLGTGTMEHQQSMGAAMAMQSMVRAGAGLSFAGIKMATKLGTGTVKHGLGTALGGAGYASRAFGATRLGMGVRSWGGTIAGANSLGANQPVSISPTMGGGATSFDGAVTPSASNIGSSQSGGETASISPICNSNGGVSVSKSIGYGSKQVLSNLNSAMVRGVKELGKGGIVGLSKNWSYVKNGINKGEK